MRSREIRASWILCFEGRTMGLTNRLIAVYEEGITSTLNLKHFVHLENDLSSSDEQDWEVLIGGRFHFGSTEGIESELVLTAESS